MQVGGAGLGFGAPTAAPGKPSMAGFAPAAVPASPADAGGMQGFARSNMESNENLSAAAPPIAPAPAPPLPPLPPGVPAASWTPPLPPSATQAGARSEMRQMQRGKPSAPLPLHLMQAGAPPH